MEPSDPTNTTIADALEELADLYELDNANIHRVLAYRTAARTVREASVSVAQLALAHRATELSGIGKTLQEKILVLAQTGTIPAAQRLRELFPPGLVAINRLAGIGPKRTRLLHEELGIDSLEALREAAEKHRLRTVKGLGPKFEQSVLAALQAGTPPPTARRLLLPRAIDLGQSLIDGLLPGAPPGTTATLAGSIRRSVDAVKDIDIVAIVPGSPADRVALARSLGELEEIEALRTTPTGVGVKARTHSQIDVDLRIAAPDHAGNLLQHFTGSGPHNSALRTQAAARGLHVSEYGVLDDQTSTLHTHETEQEVYRFLGFDFIEPELREDRGELEAALALPMPSPRGSDITPSLPTLIGLDDIRGDLHAHTIASDGHATIEEMALAARDLGHEYLAITDHSASHGFGNHVSPEDLLRQIDRVRSVNDRLPDIHVLAGSEVNILPDGSLDYEDDILAQLDWVLASVHTSFAITSEAMTTRMITAIEHPLVDAIGHPTGRLIARRSPYALDLDAVFSAAARTHTALEINANPDRRDLSDTDARAALKAGVMVVIDSDAHYTTTLANLRWGVATARRAWATPQDVLNTRSWPDILRWRERTRR